MRSYPRWIWEFKRCNVILSKAECCSVTVMEEERDCEKCTHITLPMPEPFGENVVVEGFERTFEIESVSREVIDQRF